MKHYVTPARLRVVHYVSPNKIVLYCTVSQPLLTSVSEIAKATVIIIIVSVVPREKNGKEFTLKKI